MAMAARTWNPNPLMKRLLLAAAMVDPRRNTQAMNVVRRSGNYERGFSGAAGRKTESRPGAERSGSNFA
jgi:hypothetical protein